MIKQLITFTLLTFSSMAFTEEYKDANVNTEFKKMHGKIVKSEEFKNDYKLEGAQNVDRQIASEKIENEQDRMPNSIMETKENLDEKKLKETPSPWLFKTEQTKN